MVQSILDLACQFTNDAIVILGDGLRVIEGNDRFHRMYGYGSQDAARLRAGDLCAPFPAEAQDQPTGLFEAQGRRKDGAVFPVEVSTRTVHLGGHQYRIAIMRDITERVRAQDSIFRLKHLYEAISASNRAVVFSQTEEEMFTRICQACTDYGMKMAWIGLAQDGVVTPRCYSGEGAEYLDGIEIVLDSHSPNAQGPTGTAIRTGNYVLCNDFQTDPRTAPWHERGLRFGWNASAAFPLTRQGALVGALTLYSETLGYFGGEETRLLNELVGDISFALDRFDKDRERRQLDADLKFSRMQIIRSLARAGEYRDNDTGDHILRMSHFCQSLAQAAGLSDEFSTLLLWASPMHDVGKIGIPDAILLKPARLEPHEFEIMKTHAQIGAEILSDANDPLLRMAKSVAFTHHEKWDGSGYPAGLKGHDIPIEGRIAALCDVYDALTSDRPYKQAWSQDQVWAYIDRNSGQHFDPDLARVFLSIQSEITAIRARYASRS